MLLLLLSRPCHRSAQPCMSAFVPPPPLASLAELQEALGRFRDAVEADATDAEALLNHGLVAKRLRDFSLAAASLSSAVELCPADDDAKSALADVLAEMGLDSEAEALLCDLLTRDQPAASRLKLALANLRLSGLGKRAEALRAYREACEAGPSPVALLAGIAADSMGEHAAAAGFYRDALSQDEHDENAALHLMHGLLRAGDSESAAALRPKLPTHVLSRCPEMA